MAYPPTTSRKRFEQRFERWLWRVRLIAIVPVVMSLVSTAASFVLGTGEIFKALYKIFSGQIEPKGEAKLLAELVSGVDLYLIGIALLIFGYGVYELLISDIEAARGSDQNSSGLLDIRSLDGLKEKLVKVIIVALIVAAFKAMLSFPITDGSSLAFFCVSVLLLAISGYLVTGGIPGSRGPK
jgi:uncharacterized membrane protein YqhA